jgi:hypothetical protein
MFSEILGLRVGMGLAVGVGVAVDVIFDFLLTGLICSNSLVVLFFTQGLSSMPITHVHYIYLRWRLQMYPAPSSEEGCSSAYLHQHDQSLFSF